MFIAKINCDTFMILFEDYFAIFMLKAEIGQIIVLWHIHCKPFTLENSLFFRYQ